MRVLFVCSGKQGGANPIIRNQGESLRKAGVELDYYIVYGGAKGYLKNIKPLRKQIKERNYDVIHAHYAFMGYVANMATIGMDIPIVVSLMGSDIWEHKWYPPAVRFAAKRWGAVIVKSAEMRNRVGIERAIVVPNGVNMERFREMDKTVCQKQLGWDTTKLHVLFPARPFEERKNWPLASSAVESLNKRISNGTLMIGSRKEIEIHAMVGVKNEETPIYYNAADAVALPSFYEGSANAVKEAMACDTPIVTTDMGDCRERVEGVNGSYVANTYEVEEFAELLGKALSYGRKSNGRERLLADGIADYQIAERLIKIYENSKK